MKNLRHTQAGKEASERLGRVTVSTRSVRLSNASSQRTLGRKEEGSSAQAGSVTSEVPGASRKVAAAQAKRFVSSAAAAAMAHAKGQDEHSDAAGKLEGSTANAVRAGIAKNVRRIPGAGTVVRTVSSRSGLSENAEAVGQQFAREGARRAGLRTARVAGRVGKRSAVAASRAARKAPGAVVELSKRTGVTASRAAQASARAAARAVQASATLLRSVTAAISGVVTGGPFLAALAAVMVAAALLASFLTAFIPTVQSQQCSAPATNMAGSSYAGYNEPAQRQNAAEIIRAGKDAGLGTRDITIGVMTAMGESTLRILAYGDDAGPDSRGLFQQRDSWGPLSVRMDAYASAQLFFKALALVPNRDKLTPTDAASAVQHNDTERYPNHYAPYWNAAVSLVSSLGGGIASACDTAMGVPGSLGKGDDYPHKDGIYNAINPVTSFALRNCTDFAWWRMMQQLGITDPARMNAAALGPGNGATWGFAWKRAGWTVTMTPKVGAIIWYGPGNPGGSAEYGHVAVVKAITKDGKVLEEGYNYGFAGKYYTKTIDPKSPSGYLLIPSKEQYSKFS